MGRRQRPKYLEKDHKKVIFITKNLKSTSSQEWMWSITDAYVKQKFKLTEKYLIRDWNYEKKVKNGSRLIYWREISSLHLNQDKNMLRTHSFMLFTINNLRVYATNICIHNIILVIHVKQFTRTTKI